MAENIPNFLRSHMKAKHSGETQKKTSNQLSRQNLVSSVTCTGCGKEFGWSTYHKRHKKLCLGGENMVKAPQLPGQPGEEGNQSKGLVCTTCNLTFVSKLGWLNHMRESHPHNLKITCDICHMRFETRVQLKNHMKDRHKINAKGVTISDKSVVKCGICDKLLSSAKRLKDHMSTVHEGQKRYDCRFCDKKFSSNHNRQVHEGRYGH